MHAHAWHIRHAGADAHRTRAASAGDVETLAKAAAAVPAYASAPSHVVLRAVPAGTDGRERMATCQGGSGRLARGRRVEEGRPSSSPATVTHLPMPQNDDDSQGRWSNTSRWKLSRNFRDNCHLRSLSRHDAAGACDSSSKAEKANHCRRPRRPRRCPASYLPGCRAGIPCRPSWCRYFEPLRLWGSGSTACSAGYL